MDDKIVRVNFGKEAREASKALGRLLGLVERQDDELLSDPRRLFGLASEAIARRDMLIREAQDALRPHIDYRPSTEFHPIRTVTVDADEYKRLRKAASIINRGVD